MSRRVRLIFDIVLWIWDFFWNPTGGSLFKDYTKPAGDFRSMVTTKWETVRVTVTWGATPGLDLVKAAMRQSSLIIGAAPGAHLLDLARLLCSQTTVENVYAQIVLDMREEYFEALAKAAPWRARFALLRGYWAFGEAFVVHTLSGVLRLAWRIVTTK